MTELDLSVEQSKLFQEILKECMEAAMKDTPEKPLTCVWSMAWNKFHGTKWTMAINPAQSLLSPHEYKEIDLTAGPDLVALPRRRYTSLRRFLHRKNDGLMSPYQKFVKEQSALLREEEPNANPTEKLKIIGNRWRNLDDGGKARYKTTDN
jgi:beta-galactosidase GanA